MKFFVAFLLLSILLSSCSERVPDQKDRFSAFETTVPQENPSDTISEDSCLTSVEIPAESDTFLVDREMDGEPIDNILLNSMNGADVYHGDVSTDYQFSATWDLSAPDGERLVTYTGKPELFQLELFSDHLAMSSSGTPWDMFVTDRTISQLLEEAYKQYNADGTVLVNEFMRFHVTTKNGDTIPLSVIGFEKGGGHISESRFFFDRSVTEEAMSFAMEIFLPAGVEPEQYPSMSIHNREYVLWKAAEDRPKQAEDMSMDITIRRDSGYDFYIVESSESAMWFDAMVVDETLCLTTDVELSGALYEEIQDCSPAVWDNYGEYTQEIVLKKLPKILDIRMTTLERDATKEKVNRIHPEVLVQKNDDGTTSILLTGILYERMVGCTLKIQLPE